MRDNIDPHGLSTDEEVRAVLEQVGMSSAMEARKGEHQGI